MESMNIGMRLMFVTCAMHLRPVLAAMPLEASALLQCTEPCAAASTQSRAACVYDKTLTPLVAAAALSSPPAPALRCANAPPLLGPVDRLPKRRNLVDCDTKDWQAAGCRVTGIHYLHDMHAGPRFKLGQHKAWHFISPVSSSKNGPSRRYSVIRGFRSSCMSR